MNNSDYLDIHLCDNCSLEGTSTCYNLSTPIYAFQICPKRLHGVNIVKCDYYTEIDSGEYLNDTY